MNRLEKREGGEKESNEFIEEEKADDDVHENILQADRNLDEEAEHNQSNNSTRTISASGFVEHRKRGGKMLRRRIVPREEEEDRLEKE